MRQKIELGVSFESDSENPDGLAADVSSFIRSKLVGLEHTWYMVDIEVEVENIEDLSITCPRCGRDCQDYEMENIENYYGRMSSELFCEKCRNEFDTLLERALDEARDNAEYTFEQEGDW